MVFEYYGGSKLTIIIVYAMENFFYLKTVHQCIVISIRKKGVCLPQTSDPATKEWHIYRS